MDKAHRIALIVAFLAIVICAVVAVGAVFSEGSNATVPSLVGMQLSDASDELQKQGLLAKSDRINSTEPADTVLSQSIPAGRKISKGKVIILRVSRGGTVTPIPDVRGMKFEDAVRKLDESGFKVSSVVRVNDKTQPAGSVIAQNPQAPTRVPTNTMLSLLVSSGARGDSSFVVIPDLRGQTVELAEGILKQSGLVLGEVKERASSSVPEGSVINSEPREGRKIPAGAKVNLVTAVKGEETVIPPTEPPTERDTIVRKLVVRNSQPASIPSKIPNTAETPRPEKQNAKPPVPPKPAKPEPNPDPKPARTEAVEVKQTVQHRPEPTPKEPVEVKPAVPIKQEPPKPVETPAVAAPAAETPPQEAPKAEEPRYSKVARIKYNAPPIVRPMELQITISDESGTRTVVDKTLQPGGEHITAQAEYNGEATVTIKLGGEVVWRELHR